MIQNKIPKLSIQEKQLKDPYSSLVLNKLLLIKLIIYKFLKTKGKPLESGEVYVNGQKYSNGINKDGSFKLEKLVSGTYKINLKSKNIYYEEKLINIDLSSSSCLQKESSQHQRLLSLSKFIAKSFDVCGQVKITKNSGLLSDLSKSVQIKCYKAGQTEADKPNFLISASLDQDLKYCVVLDVNTNYIIKAELSDNLSQVLRLVPIERKLTLTDSPLFNINFEQLEAKLEGLIKLLPGQVAPSDFSLNLKSVDTKWTQDIPVKCSSKEAFTECSFSLSNLLFGNYYLTTNYDDLFCWKKQNDQQKHLTISVNSEIQNVLIEQTGYKLNIKLSHRNSLLKITDTTKNVLFTKNVLTQSDQIGDLCLPTASDYLAIIESCHKFTNSNSNTDQDVIPISSSLFKKNANTLNLNAQKHQLAVDIVFKFDDLNDKKLVTKDDLTVEIALKDSQQLESMKFSLKSETKNEIIFTSKTCIEAGQSVTLIAKSNKVLFESNNKHLTINEHVCESNYANFEAKLGIFIIGSIKPSDIESIDLTLKSTTDNTTLSQIVINANQGFKLGPLKSPFSLYDVELSKSGYLFNKISSESKNKDVYNLNYLAEKLGQLKVNVVDATLKTNLENVLLSLSSENRQFRQTIRTDQNGQVSFDNLKPGLYYLIVMMQEYEFKPNSHPVQISDGFHMNLVVEADRVAYSCFGKVTSINGQAEKDIQVEAVGVRSQSDSDADLENCKSSRESSEVERGLGTYRIRNLRPNCEYELSVKSLKNEDSKRIFKIVPKSFTLQINNSDIIDKNFVVIDQLDKVDVSLAVTYKCSDDVIPVSNRQLNNFFRVKLVRTTQPNMVIQTQYAPANSIVYFNPLTRDQTQQYSIQVELLMPSTVSIFGTLNQHQQNQLQQLQVIDRTEASFYTDSAHKHLSARFDLDKKKESSNAYDIKQQQYQNFYFTLPLFILIVGLILNSSKAQQNLSNIRNSIQQKGGLVNFIQSLISSKPVQAVQETTGSKTGKAVKLSKKSKDQSSDNELSKATKVKVAPQPVIEHISTDQSENELVEYSTEEGEVVNVVAKRKVKKIF